jgi:GT2 family glycosyltransferase
MKLLGAGYGVYFDPKLIVWHDSPAAAKKSLRWFELATRNWIWLCRRHGRGLGALAGAMLGWAWAHRLAGVSAAAHARILKGAAAGVLGAAGPKQGSGASLRRLLRLRFGRAGA